MDVSVHAEHRRVGGDGVASGGAADRHHAGAAGRDDRAQVLVELGRVVQPRGVGRHVQVHDRLAGVGDLGHHLVDPAAEILLGHVARARPRRDVAVAHPHDLEAAVEIDDRAVRVLDHARAAQHLVDLEVVVVAAADQHPHAGAAEAVLGHVDPALDALEDQRVEQFLGLVLVTGVGLVLVRGGKERVLTGVADHGKQVVELGTFADLAFDAGEAGLVLAALGLDHGHDELPGDVAADHDRVALVVLRGGEELLPAPLAAVDVGAEVHAQACHLQQQRVGSSDSTEGRSRLFRPR